MFSCSGISYGLKNLEIMSGMRKQIHWSFSALYNTSVRRQQKRSVSSKLIKNNLFWHNCWLQCSTCFRKAMNARGLYWFKLGMDKFVGATGSCQTHRHCTWLKVLKSREGLGRSLIHTCSALPLFPDHWPWATWSGQLAKCPSDLAWAALPASWKGPLSPQGYTLSCGTQLQGCDGQSAVLLPPNTPVMDIPRLFKLYLFSN